MMGLKEQQARPESIKEARKAKSTISQKKRVRFSLPRKSRSTPQYPRKAKPCCIRYKLVTKRSGQEVTGKKSKENYQVFQSSDRFKLTKKCSENIAVCKKSKQEHKVPQCDNSRYILVGRKSDEYYRKAQNSARYKLVENKRSRENCKNPRNSSRCTLTKKRSDKMVVRKNSSEKYQKSQNYGGYRVGKRQSKKKLAAAKKSKENQQLARNSTRLRKKRQPSCRDKLEEEDANFPMLQRSDIAARDMLSISSETYSPVIPRLSLSSGRERTSSSLNISRHQESGRHQEKRANVKVLPKKFRRKHRMKKEQSQRSLLMKKIIIEKMKTLRSSPGFGGSGIKDDKMPSPLSRKRGCTEIQAFTPTSSAGPVENMETELETVPLMTQVAETSSSQLDSTPIKRRKYDESDESLVRIMRQFESNQSMNRHIAEPFNAKPIACCQSR